MKSNTAKKTKPSVRSKGIDMKPMQCVLCGKKEQLQELFPATFSRDDLNKHIYSARRLPDRIHYRLVKCGNCGMVFSNPILPPSVIASLYRESLCTYDERLNDITNTYVELFKSIKPLLPKNPKVVEVGCGNGFFLTALQKLRVKDVWGVEPGKDMVKQADTGLKGRIKADIFKPGQFKPSSVDLVASFHTLDHLTDPALFMKESFRILKPGGILLLVTHDTEGISVKVFGEGSPIFDIEHIYLFSKKTIGDLGVRYGFETVRAENLVNRYPLSYWLRMSGLPGVLKRFGQKAMETVGIDKTMLALAGGNISYVGRKR